MALSTTANASFLKDISPVFSNSNFNKVVKEGELDYVKNRAHKYLSYNLGLDINTYHEFLEHLYSSMLKNYRNEFIYKNEIVNKIILGRHSLNTTTVLNEFRIGKSIADLIMLNGTSVVYEIKTEYDSPERLLSQINEYRKSFLNIVVVTHHSVEKKYIEFLEKNNLKNIGLTVLTKRNTLKPKIEPIEDSSYLDITYMFKCLRKNEYCNLIKDYFGYVPNVSNTKLFRVCLELAKKMDKKEFHNRMYSLLKNRTINEKKMVSSQEVPSFLKHISLCSDFKMKDFEKINVFLNKNL